MAQSHEPSFTEADVLEALGKVYDPELGRDLVSLGMIRDVQIDGGDVSFTLVLTTPACPLRGRMEADCRRELSALPGVGQVTINWHASVPRDERLAAKVPTGIRNAIAVASGKGGVGKSTVTVNLACALACGGASVGILDADIYGPNIPMMMGVRRARPGSVEGKLLAPVMAHGVKVMSIGLLVEEGTPLVWRGPMLHNTVRQFLTDVDWGDLDYLVVDLPPGTGDVALSLTQTLPLTGVVVVTTPQAVSVADVTKCVAMFQLPDIDVEVLGVIENMSGFVAPDTGVRYDIFGRGGGAAVARQMDVPFLGEVPMDPAVRESGDLGTPVVVSQPDNPVSVAFDDIASRLAAQLSVRNLGSAGREPDGGDGDAPAQ